MLAMAHGATEKRGISISFRLYFRCWVALREVKRNSVVALFAPLVLVPADFAPGLSGEIASSGQSSALTGLFPLQPDLSGAEPEGLFSFGRLAPGIVIFSSGFGPFLGSTRGGSGLFLPLASWPSWVFFLGSGLDSSKRSWKSSFFCKGMGGGPDQEVGLPVQEGFIPAPAGRTVNAPNSWG